MAQTRHLERFLDADLAEATEYYTREAAEYKDKNATNKAKFLRYFHAYKEYQKNWELPTVDDNPQVTRQCLYRVEQMVILYINLRHKGKL